MCYDVLPAVFPSLPLLWSQCGLLIGFLVLGNAVAACVTSLAMQVAGGRNAADEERRHFKFFLLQHFLAPLLRLLKERLHAVGELCLARI